MKRSIAHFDLDTFFVSCERLQDAQLIGKPVLIGGTSDRGVVASCSYEARKFGIHSAMPMKLARQLCPEAIIVRGNSGTYIKYSDMVTEIISESVPLFEKSSVDEFYIDMTGMDKFFGSFQMMRELRERIIRETNLPISFGLSENKTVSKIATGEAKPNNQLKIHYGTEKPFLAPLAVKKIPMVGTKMQQSFRSLGVRKIQTIQEMPIELMENIFGKNGRMIWKKANGIDDSQVIEYHERKSISTERTFDRDTTDINKLKGIMTAMAENLAFQLRRGDKLTSCVAVKVRYSDFSTHSLQMRLVHTAADHILIPKVMELFERLYNKRLLVRLIGVKYSNLAQGGYQISLFENVEQTEKLYRAMDHIRDKFGDRKVMLAAGMEAKSISRFNPFNGGPPPLLANRRS